MQSIITGIPQEYLQATLTLPLPNGQLIDLEYRCHACQGKVPETGVCTVCNGVGTVPSSAARGLLALVDKYLLGGGK
jgi:hypothetical protein